MSGSRKKRSGSAQSMRSGGGGWNDTMSQGSGRSKSSKRGGSNIASKFIDNQMTNKTI